MNQVRLFCLMVIAASLTFIGSTAILAPEPTYRILHSMQLFVWYSIQHVLTHTDIFMTAFLFHLVLFANKMAGGSLTSFHSERRAS